MPYTVSRARSDNTLFGHTHIGIDVNGSPCYETACGQRIDEHWWIISASQSPVTCKKCAGLAQPDRAPYL